jgi:rhodanese-related sulfurtransferase
MLNFINLTFMAIQSAMDRVKAAKQELENLSPQQVADEMKKDDVVVIDICEANELKETGKIRGSVHAPRGMLEFYADPSLPYYKPEFEADKKIILHCVSGGKSALATQTLKQVGYTNVAHMDGGLKAWKENNLTRE